MGEREEIIEEFLELTEALFASIHPTLSLDRLASDITVAQLRVLLGLRTLGPSSMSAIANAAGVVPSTATGIVDNLFGKGLVFRKPDPNDRRRVVCNLSPAGEELVQGLWTWGRSQIGALLESMTTEQLRNAREGAKMLRDRADIK